MLVPVTQTLELGAAAEHADAAVRGCRHLGGWQLVAGEVAARPAFRIRGTDAAVSLLLRLDRGLLTALVAFAE